MPNSRAGLPLTRCFGLSSIDDRREEDNLQIAQAAYNLHENHPHRHFSSYPFSNGACKHLPTLNNY
jgi:hypothetical protein